ncbi:hypothetical protein ACFV4P_25015 [Kitasatospora sp. NPDC059795]|nr:hypothetical protein [Kitasatospora sp. CB01950]
MVWQFFVLVIASFGFPTLALLFMMGGLEYRDERQHRHHGLIHRG